MNMFYANIAVNWVLALLVVLSTTFACELGCNLQKPPYNVDWSKMPPKWYLSSHTPDETFSNVIACQIIENITNSGPDDYRIFLKNYYVSGADPRSFWFHGQMKHDSCFYSGTDEGPSIQVNSEVSLNYNDIKAVIEETKRHNSGKHHVVSTDYSTYLIFAICIKEEDELLVLVFQSTPDPSDEDMLQAENGLRIIRAHSPLEPSKCCQHDFEKKKR
ncbi:uncharacterized protein LOC120329944 isoform X1 [Styela clava]